MAYKLALLPSLSAVHPMFHVSMLKRYVPGSSHKLPYEGFDTKPNLSYKEEADQILLDYSSRTLRHQEVPLVKVLWSK